MYNKWLDMYIPATRKETKERIVSLKAWRNLIIRRLEKGIWVDPLSKKPSVLNREIWILKVRLLWTWR